MAGVYIYHKKRCMSRVYMSVMKCHHSHCFFWDVDTGLGRILDGYWVYGTHLLAPQCATGFATEVE